MKAKNENSLSARAIAYVYAREKTEEGVGACGGWGEKGEVFFQKVRVLLPKVRVFLAKVHVFLSKVYVLLPKVHVFFSQVAGGASVVVGKCLYAAFDEGAMCRRAMAIDGLLRPL